MNALIQNLTNENNSVEVILKVLKALYNSIKLAEKNFKDKNERSIIMNDIYKLEVNMKQMKMFYKKLLCYLLKCYQLVHFMIILKIILIK